MSNENDKPRLILISVVALLAVAISTRFALASIYSIASFPDSGDYIDLAKQWRSLDFTSNIGFRTPVYPIILIATGFDNQALWFLQSLMGLSISLIIFFFVLGATGSTGAAMVAALAHTLAANQLVLEAAVMTETTATLLVVAAAYAAERAWSRGWPIGLVIISALLASGATLTRPLFVVVGVVVLGLIVAFGGKLRLRAGLAFLLVFSFPILIWMGYQKVTTGAFAITTLLGFNLSNNIGGVMERAPDNFHEVRDIYLKHRQERIAKTGSHSMTIFEAREELQRRTGFNEAQLSKELQRISFHLISENPMYYLRNAIQQWYRFFVRGSIYVQEENFEDPDALKTLESINVFQRWMIRFSYAAFLILALPVTWVAWIRCKGHDKRWNSAGLLIAIVLSASVLQALVEYGGSNRFGLPTQSLAIAALVITVVTIRRSGFACPGIPSSTLGARKLLICRD
jgi:hypothetical protein